MPYKNRVPDRISGFSGKCNLLMKDLPEGTESDEKIPPLLCRFHDLRHTAVSRMLNAGIPIAKVAKIAGWSPATMVRMAARYGHFSLNELRGAVESISGAEIQLPSPVFSPVSTGVRCQWEEAR